MYRYNTVQYKGGN